MCFSRFYRLNGDDSYIRVMVLRCDYTLIRFECFHHICSFEKHFRVCISTSFAGLNSRDEISLLLNIDSFWLFAPHVFSWRTGFVLLPFLSVLFSESKFCYYCTLILCKFCFPFIIPADVFLLITIKKGGKLGYLRNHVLSVPTMKVEFESPYERVTEDTVNHS